MTAASAPDFFSGQQPLQDNLRTAKDFSRAKRHSVFVRVLRTALPVAAITLVIVFAASIFLATSPLKGVTIESTTIEEGKLVMNAPAMAGFDSKNRPYDVKANKAVQQLSEPGLVQLEEIVANLPMDEKSQAKILATTGTYDSKKETLTLRDNISISGARGMDILLKNADINIKTGVMSSDRKVVVKTKSATIDAGGILVEQNGDRVVFSNGVTMNIKPQTMKKDIAE